MTPSRLEEISLRHFPVLGLVAPDEYTIFKPNQVNNNKADRRHGSYSSDYSLR